MPARDEQAESAKRARQPDRRHGNGDHLLPGAAAIGGRRQSPRLSARPRPDARDAAVVPPRLCARQPQCAEGIPGGEGRREGADGGLRAGASRRRHSGLLRPFPRPHHVSDPGFPRPDHRLRRPRAVAGCAGQIHELARDRALPQGQRALQFRPRPEGDRQGRHRDRRRRLYGRDRAGAGRLRERRRAARHGADRKPAGAAVAHVAASRCSASTATRPA